MIFIRNDIEGVIFKQLRQIKVEYIFIYNLYFRIICKYGYLFVNCEFGYYNFFKLRFIIEFLGKECVCVKGGGVFL